MNILHTSDWHLGRVLHEQNLAPDQSRFIDQCIAHLAAHPCDAMIIAGDVFDRSIPNEDAIGLWNDFLSRYADTCPDRPLVVIAGNHDSAARLSTASAIIERAGIHIRGGAERIAEPVAVIDAAGERADIWCLPFLFSGALSESGPEGERLLHSQAAVLAEAVARIRRAMSPDRINILVSHCFAAGGSVSDSERTLVGTAMQIDAQLFEGFDYVALGHLHRGQKLSEEIRYSGTPLAYSFSEAGQAKVMLSVELRKAGPPAVEEIAVVPLRVMRDLRGTLGDLLENPAYGEAEDAYVRVSLTEPAAGTSPVLRLRRRFPHLLEFRDHVFEDRGTGTDDPAIDLEDSDILDDFLAFEQRIRGEEGASEALVAAFRQLQESVEAGAAK